MVMKLYVYSHAVNVYILLQQLQLVDMEKE